MIGLLLARVYINKIYINYLYDLFKTTGGPLFLYHNIVAARAVLLGAIYFTSTSFYFYDIIALFIVKSTISYTYSELKIKFTINVYTKLIVLKKYISTLFSLYYSRLISFMTKSKQITHIEKEMTIERSLYFLKNFSSVSSFTAKQICLKKLNMGIKIY